MTEPCAPSPILEAVYRDDDARLRELLAQGPRLDVFEAAAVGDAPRLRAALRADPGAARGFAVDGWTPLHLAAFFGRADAVEALLAAGADLRAVSRNAHGNMPLHAALAGHAPGRIAVMLLARGADPRATDRAGYTPLHHAAARGDVAMINAILALGVDVDARNHDDETPLALAEKSGHVAAARRIRGELP